MKQRKQNTVTFLTHKIKRILTDLNVVQKTDYLRNIIFKDFVSFDAGQGYQQYLITNLFRISDLNVSSEQGILSQRPISSVCIECSYILGLYCVQSNSHTANFAVNIITWYLIILIINSSFQTSRDSRKLGLVFSENGF